MKKYTVFALISCIFFLTGCCSVKPQAEKYRSPGSWNAFADFDYRTRKIASAKSAINDLVAANSGYIVYTYDRENHSVIQFAVDREVYGKFADSLLNNPDLVSYSHSSLTAQQDRYNDTPVAKLHPAGDILVTVSLTKKRLPGPLYAVLYVPAVIVEKLIFLD